MFEESQINHSSRYPGNGIKSCNIALIRVHLIILVIIFMGIKSPNQIMYIHCGKQLYRTLILSSYASEKKMTGLVVMPIPPK